MEGTLATKAAEKKEAVPGSGLYHEEGFRIYEIVFNESHGHTSDRKRKFIKVPEGWKVTFSAFNPGGKGGGYDTNTPTLRFYEADTKQRAVFRNVYSFMDLTVESMDEVIIVNDESSLEDDGVTSRSAFQKRAKEVGFVPTF